MLLNYFLDLPQLKRTSNLFVENPDNPIIDLKRITALWAFSEAAFGGILHALKIPFTGMFIGCTAVIFISLIAYISKDKTSIMKSTIIVILVKAIVSPHSPLAAYAAVLVQGSLGYFFFTIFNSKKIAGVLLGFFAMFFSALQKLIFLTILFGSTLWQSIDLFSDYVLVQLGFDLQNPAVSVSYLLIFIYSIIHITAGIIAGLFASSLPATIERERMNVDTGYVLALQTNDYFEEINVKQKRNWLQRPTGIVLLIFLITVTTLSYFTDELGKNIFYEIVIMLIRLFTIMILWFYIVAPHLMKSFIKVVDKKKFKYAGEINSITELFPNFRKIINYSWKKSSSKAGIERIKKFLFTSLILLLIIEMDTKADANANNLES